MRPCQDIIPDFSAPMRVDPVVYWSIDGFAGVLAMLERQQSGEVHYPEQALRNLEYVIARLDNIIRRARNQPTHDLPGGITGALVRHFGEQGPPLRPPAS